MKVEELLVMTEEEKLIADMLFLLNYKVEDDEDDTITEQLLDYGFYIRESSGWNDVSYEINTEFFKDPLDETKFRNVEDLRQMRGDLIIILAGDYKLEDYTKFSPEEIERG